MVSGYIYPGVNPINLFPPQTPTPGPPSHAPGELDGPQHRALDQWRDGGSGCGRTTVKVGAVGRGRLPQRLAATLLKRAAADPTGLVRRPQGRLAALLAATRPKALPMTAPPAPA